MARRRLQLNVRLSEKLDDALDDYRRSLKPIPDLSDAARTLLRDRLTELGFYQPDPADPPNPDDRPAG